MALYALVWDESDENDPDTVKLRRAVYATLDEAIVQGTHDHLCLRCRVFDGGRPTLECTGLDPHDPTGTTPCPDCEGTHVQPSRRIVGVEEIEHVERNEMNRGKVVWTPEGE